MNRQFGNIWCVEIFDKSETETFVIIDDVLIVSPRIHTDEFNAPFFRVMNSPFKNKPEKALPLKFRVDNYTVEINRITRFHLPPKYLIRITDTEHHCYQAI